MIVVLSWQACHGFNHWLSAESDGMLNLFPNFINNLEKYCDPEAVKKFASKLLRVIKECKEQKVFQTLLQIFWIKVECIIKDSINSQIMRERMPVTSTEIVASETNVDEENISVVEDNQLVASQTQTSQLRTIWDENLENIDAAFEKTFNPESHLNVSERACGFTSLLWIITKLHELYFYYVFRKIRFWRKFHRKLEPCMFYCSYLFVCSYVIIVPIILLTPSALVFSFGVSIYNVINSN